MSGRKFAALLIGAGIGAALGGLPGALIGYVAVLLGSAFVPWLQGGSGACDVPRTEAPSEEGDDERDRTAA